MHHLTVLLFCVCLQLNFAVREATRQRVTIPSLMKEFAASMPTTKDFIKAMVKKAPSKEAPPGPSLGNPGPDRPEEEGMREMEQMLFEPGSDRPTATGAETIQSMVTPPAAGCQPKDVTVTLPSDPDPSVLYYPSCVTAKRCGGCCMQDQHECGPTRVSKINNKVVKARYPYLGAPNFLFEGLVDVELDNHLECSCQCKNKPHHCDIAKHVYEAATCSCRCRNEDQRENCVAPQTWDNHKCACTCPALKYCQAHEYFSFSTCRCETSRDVVSDALSVGTVVDQVCVSTRCRANYVAMNIMGQCQCKMVSQWGDLAMANANARVTGLPLPTTPVPEVTTRRRRPGRRPRPSK